MTVVGILLCLANDSWSRLTVCVFHRDLSDAGCFWRSHVLGGDGNPALLTRVRDVILLLRTSPPPIGSGERILVNNGPDSEGQHQKFARPSGVGRPWRAASRVRTKYVKNSFGHKCTRRRSEDKNKVQFTWFFSRFFRRPTRCHSKFRCRNYILYDKTKIILKTQKRVKNA